MLGASRESTVNRVLFGDIPEKVAAASPAPVIIVKRRVGPMTNWLRRALDRLSAWMPRVSAEERVDVYRSIRRGARPDADYFVMIGLAAAIASFGLLLNSPAVIIGAMLVAPLMAAIVGLGMGIMMGDVRLLKLAASATLRGMLLAITVGFVIGLLASNSIQTGEVLSRTQPALLDLGVALASGAAGAYALCRKDVSASLPGVAIAAALVPPLATVGIGLAVGGLLGWLIAQLIARLDDYLIETTLTTVLAFGAYLVAERLHFSGVLAVVAAGLVNGNLGPRGMSPTTRIVLFNFWEYLAFVVYGLTWLINRRTRRVSTPYQHVLFWGGLRGAISLALALSLPATLAERELLRVMAFGVVLFTLLGQGTTMQFLLRWLKLTRRTVEALEFDRRHGRLMAARAARERLEQLHREGSISDPTWEQLAREMDDHIQGHLEQQRELLNQYPALQAEELEDARRWRLCSVTA